MVNRLIVPLLLCFLFSINSFAATFYIKNNGNDNSNGTSDATAWKTLYKASVSISNNDRVLLKRGDVWKVTHNKRTSLAVGMGLYVQHDDIFIGAYGTGPKPIIDATAMTDIDDVRSTQAYSPVQVGVRYGNDSSGVTIKDLDLRGPALGSAIAAYSTGPNLLVSGCDLRGAGWASEALVVYGNSDNNFIVEDCFFDQIKGNSVGYSKSIEIRGGNGHIIRKNIFYGYGPGGALRFSDHGKGGIIEQNYFYHPDNRRNSAWALVIRSGSGGTYIVRNNVFDLTGSSGMSNNDLTGGRFWFDYKPTTRKIYNNTFISDGKGYGLKGHGNTAYVYNNIFYNLYTAYDNGGGAKLRDNIFWSCDKKYDDPPGLEQGSSLANPEIKNPSMSNNNANDASLTVDSDLAINSGYENDSAIPSNDFNGYERVNTDIGAFEYTDASTSNTPSPPTNLAIISHD